MPHRNGRHTRAKRGVHHDYRLSTAWESSKRSKESSNILGLSSHLLVASTPTISTSLSPSMLANIMHISINRYGCIKPVTSYNLGSDRNSSKKDCLLAGSLAPLLACLLAGWLAGLLACSLAPFLACLLTCLLTCLLACCLACLLAGLLPGHTSLRET